MDGRFFISALRSGFDRNNCAAVTDDRFLILAIRDRSQ